MYSAHVNVRTVAVIVIVVYFVEESYEFQIIDNAYTSYFRTKRQATCSGSQFKCATGDKCIPGYKKCDGLPNCDDSSDETVACRQETCPTYSFRCDYGACVSGAAKCDGKKQCADNSDENHPDCRKNVVPTSAPNSVSFPGNCRVTQYMCANKQCIRRSLRCDGKRDCIDGSDETVAACKNEQCPSLSFQCAYGACLSGSVRCNGVQDCVDNSDEEPVMCGYTVPVTPSIATPSTSAPMQFAGSCTLPEKPKNGDYTLMQQGNSIVLAYRCKPTFRLIPNLTRNDTEYVFCHAGNWLPVIPRCISTCPPRKSSSVKFTCTLDGVSQDCNEPMLERTVVRMECKMFYKTVLSGDPKYHYLFTSKCKDGTWDTDILSCFPECGILAKSKAHAVNAYNTSIIEHPWHVAIYRQEDNKPIAYHCGGTIIQTKVILSAAHCFSEVTTGAKYPEKEFYVAAAKNYRDYDHPDDAPNVQRRRVKKILLHSEYKGFTYSFSSDIALVVLDYDLDFSTIVTRVCFGEQYKSAMQNLATVVGWGITREQGVYGTSRLQQLNVPIVDNEECARKVPVDFQQFVLPDKICAGYFNGSSVCSGDSGGGLVTKDTNGRYFIIGIVSNGPTEGNFCNNHQITVYTNVTRYLDFVKSSANLNVEI